MNSDELNMLIKQGEGYNLEFKRSLTNDISKEMCAFANANGGKVILGVNDKGSVTGINLTNSLSSQIQDIARNIDPPVGIVIDFIDDVAVIDVTEGKEKPYSSHGKFYLRYGANSQQLNRDEIRDFFRKEGHLLFDETPNTAFDIDRDFSEDNFRFFLERAGISAVIDNQDILKNLRLIEDGQLKNAGVLLFCQEISGFIPQATISCVLYQGITKYKILDRKDYEEDLYSNYISGINYLLSKLNSEYIIKSGLREEKPEIPEDALREALLNALAHRDYHVSGSNVLVEIFSDRVEITNPGGLVNGITINDLGKRSLSRNTLLSGLMQRISLIEKVGSGIARMRNSMEDYGLKGPDFDINDNWFSVVFRRPVWLRATIGGGSSFEASLDNTGTNLKTDFKTDLKTQDRIVVIIKERPFVTAKEIAEIIGLSEGGVKYHLAKLRKKDILVREGPTKGGKWIIKDDGDMNK
jgi:ATP-dependent DNA helicase RecG